jgi:hypothetical protein
MSYQDDGFGTRITVTANATHTFEETAVTPTGFEGDDPVEQTSNNNTKFRSFAPGALITKSSATATVYYEKDKVEAIYADLQIPGTITVTFEDTSDFTDNGWMQSFVPDEQSGGERPTATLTIAWEGESAAGADSYTYTAEV